ncbi:MAG: polyprenyl synthetase family protein [Chloroflexota bacterium]|nr:polyprenyl synthetase family protein [Chloroflexota bacterium]
MSKRISIPRFVDGVTTNTNGDSRRIITAKGFSYGDMLEDGLKVFKKRWDAALVTCVYCMLKPDEVKARQVATIASLVTPAVFILDDLIDQSKHREGRKSFWMKHGKDQTLIATTTYVNLFLEHVAEFNPDDRQLARLAQDSIYLMLQGEYRDITRNKQGILSEEEYWTLCYEKAGAITEVGGKLASTVAGASKKEERIIVRGAALIGILSQVLDDIMDMEDDFAHGKTSLAAMIVGKTDASWEELASKKVSSRIQAKTDELCDEGIALTHQLRQNEYTALLRDVFLCWKNFSWVLMGREDWVDICRKLGAVGIEKAFDMMFYKMKPDMKEQDINLVFDTYMQTTARKS